MPCHDHKAGRDHRKFAEFKCDHCGAPSSGRMQSTATRRSTASTDTGLTSMMATATEVPHRAGDATIHRAAAGAWGPWGVVCSAGRVEGAYHSVSFQLGHDLLFARSFVSHRTPLHRCHCHYFPSYARIDSDEKVTRCVFLQGFGRGRRRARHCTTTDDDLRRLGNQGKPRYVTVCIFDLPLHGGTSAASSQITQGSIRLIYYLGILFARQLIPFMTMCSFVVPFVRLYDLFNIYHFLHHSSHS